MAPLELQEKFLKGTIDLTPLTSQNKLLGMEPLELRKEVLEGHDQLDTLDIIKETNQYKQYMKILLIHIK